MKSDIYRRSGFIHLTLDIEKKNTPFKILNC